MAIEVFNRFEHKYKMDTKTLEKVLKIIESRMDIDRYCVNRKTYTIANLYYDTPNDTLIRKTLSKPVYKEKLRLRSYGVPDDDSDVYLEIKKKCNGLVNKRRTTFKLKEAYDFTCTGEKPMIKEYMNEQVISEMEYFLQIYRLQPKVYIAYDRLAYFEKENDDLRISFDTNIRTRRNDLKLECGDYGKPLLDNDTWLMEIKTSTAKPLWVCDILDEFNIRRNSFSKYGTEFRQTIQKKTNKQIILNQLQAV